MTFFQAVILGVIEGVTEFLPISSTGHLILANQVLGITSTDFVKSFEIAIQLGAILAVVVLFWRRVWGNRQLAGKVIAAFIPTGIIGLALYKIVKTFLLGNEQVVLWSLLLGGLAIIIFEKWYRRRQFSIGAEDLSYRQAVVVGVVQALAIIPGVSRSAATTMGGLALGLSREAIVEFSFLLAVPTMLAATGLDLVKSGFAFSGNEWFLLAVGFLSSFLVALAAVRWLLRYIRHHDFTVFGVYRMALALAFWLAIMVS